MRAAAVGAALALALGACGEDDRPPATGGPVATAAVAPTTATAPADVASGEEAPARTATAPREAEPPAAVASEDREGGAGDEEPIRVPVVFTFTRSGGVRPATVAVPAFFAIELGGVSRDGRAHEIAVGSTTVAVPAGGRASARIEGLRAGRHPVTIDGRERAATIVAGVEPGP